MKENWFALLISILRNCHQEQAFEMYWNGYNNKCKKYEAEDMAELKQSGMTYKQIGEMCGLDASTIHKRIKRFE